MYDRVWNHQDDFENLVVGASRPPGRSVSRPYLPHLCADSHRTDSPRQREHRLIDLDLFRACLRWSRKSPSPRSHGTPGLPPLSRPAHVPFRLGATSHDLPAFWRTRTTPSQHHQSTFQNRLRIRRSAASHTKPQPHARGTSGPVRRLNPCVLCRASVLFVSAGGVAMRMQNNRRLIWQARGSRTTRHIPTTRHRRNAPFATRVKTS
ncbi:hypothetical protein C8T65DRAFT_154145 [Cerioporus squamosus]|nr:hypothetical protein C8T65DRAFT_154145 [Cerioporus squamosus]